MEQSLVDGWKQLRNQTADNQNIIRDYFQGLLYILLMSKEMDFYYNNLNVNLEISTSD